MKVTAECLLDGIRSAARAVVERQYSSDCLTELLERLRDTLAAARVVGVPESEINEVLEEVRQSDPELTESWDQMLKTITVDVWLQDPDGNRVRGNTVVIDWLLWADDADRVLDDVVEELRSDLETRWEIVKSSVVQG
jgi:hypothetical protein